MSSCCKFYNEILVYTKVEEFLHISNDFHLHKTEFAK
jgi:hypothetical protein